MQNQNETASKIADSGIRWINSCNKVKNKDIGIDTQRQSGTRQNDGAVLD